MNTLFDSAEAQICEWCGEVINAVPFMLYGVRVERGLGGCRLDAYHLDCDQKMQEGQRRADRLTCQPN